MRKINEEDIISRIQQGKANKQIAADLKTTKGYIECLVHKMLRKYDCKNRTELAMKFKEVA